MADFDAVWKAQTLDALDGKHALDATIGVGVSGAATIAPTVADGGVAGVAENAAVMARLPLLDLRAPRAAERGANVDVSGDFRQLSSLGEGGMGHVDLARQETLGRDVAVKQIKDDITDARAIESLLGEARMMGHLEHPNIVPVHLLARDRAGRPVLVMKRIEGTSWRALIDDPKHPFWQKLLVTSDEPLVAHLEILMAVCNAVHFAHSRGFSHRDIKPDNVMLGEFGEIYLLDWGVAAPIAATVNANGSIVGTPAFMAPEMVATPGVATRALDVYLLGATLHLLLTGAYRHTGSSLREMLQNAFAGAPAEYLASASLPPELVTICRRATAYEPSDRYASAQLLREALARYLRHRSSNALAREAQVLVERARQELASSTPNNRRVLTLLGDSRFGFVQALREWASNPDARRGLDECLIVSFDYELGIGNLEGARGLLDELGGAHPELVQRLEKLENERRLLRERDERLTAIDRDQDPKVGRNVRRIFLATLAVAAVGITLFGGLLRPEQKPGYPQLIGFNVFLLVLCVVGTLAFRRQILTSAVNRRGAMTIIITYLAGTFMRALGWAYGVEPELILHLELVVYTACVAIGAISFLRSLWIAIPPFIIGAIAGLFFRERVPTIFAVAGVAGLILTIYAWQLAPESKTARKPAQPTQ